MVDRRNIYTLIQNINREKIIKLIYALLVAFKTFDKPCTLFLTSGTCQKGSSFAMLIKRLCQGFRFFYPAAKDNSFNAPLVTAIKICIIQDIFNTLFTRQTHKIGIIIQKLAIYNNFTYAVIMKRHQHIFSQGLIQTDFVSNIMVKGFKNIAVIRTLRRCCHAQQKLWLKIAQHLLIALGSCMMRFVDNNIIKRIRRKGMQVFILHQCLYSSKNVVPVYFSVTAGKQACCDMLINNLLKALLRFTRNQSAMHNKQAAFRLCCPHVKGRKIRFTCTGSRNQQSAILALCPQRCNIL